MESEVKIDNAMNCDDLQPLLSLYVDDGLSAEERVGCYQHLEICPVCRAHVAELRTLRSRLAMLSRPAVPADLVASINAAVAAEAADQRARRNAPLMEIINDWAMKWLHPRPMRYAF